MKNPFNIGLLFLGGMAFIHAVLGFLGIEVWIRNRGWVELSFKESLFLFFVGLILFGYAKYLRYEQKKDKTL